MGKGKANGRTTAQPGANSGASDIEVWRPIPGRPGYEASTLGRIRSLDRHLQFEGRWGPTTRFHSGRILRPKPKPNGCGGIYWAFYADGGFTVQVNRAVCAAFNGEPPTSKHEAAHLDGDTNNNRPENLIWATPVENASHKQNHGTNPAGTRNGMSRLRERDIRPIFESYIAGSSPEEIGRANNVTAGAIRAIVSGKTWAFVDVGDLRNKARIQAKANLERTWIAAAARMAERDHNLRPSCQN